MDYWVQRISDHAQEGIIKVLVGNKAEGPENIVSFEEGKAFGDKHSMKYFEVSAKDNQGIKTLFNYLVDTVFEAV